MKQTFLIVLGFCSLIATTADSFSYRVKAGDTPTQILRQFCPTLIDLERENPGRLGVIHEGSVIEVPLARMSDYKESLTEIDRLRKALGIKEAEMKILSESGEQTATAFKAKDARIRDLEKERDASLSEAYANEHFRSGFIWVLCIAIVFLAGLFLFKKDGDELKKQVKLLKEKIHALEEGAYNFRRYNSNIINRFQCLGNLDEGRLNFLFELATRIEGVHSGITRETLTRYIKELRAEKDKEPSLQLVK